MPRTSRPLQIFPIVLRRAEVVRIVDVTPNMRRLTLAGPELAAGTMGDGFERPPFRSEGFDDHVKLVIPPADGSEPVIGVQEETRFAWDRGALESTRDYTVRSWDREAGTFDVDVVRHDHGLAAAWAFRAEPGDEIRFAGPKSCAAVNEDAEWHLLAGDETALPAIGRWLEEAPAGTRGHVIVEIPTADDRQDIPTRADVTIEWIVRPTAPGTGTLLFEAVRRAPVPADARVYAWVGGEAMTIAPIRRYLRNELGLPKEDVEVVGYWRRPAVAAQAPDAPTGDAGELPEASGADDSSTGVLHEAHEMSELMPPVVMRVAVTLGIAPHIATGVDTLPALAAATGIPAARLAPVLGALTALGFLERHGESYRNTALGGVLMEDFAQEELSLDDPVNRDELAIIDLLDVLRTGAPATRLGASLRVRRAIDPALDAAYDARAADALTYQLEPLGRLEPIRAARTLAVAGDGAAAVAAGIADGRTVVLPGDDVETWPEHDCAVLVGALEGRDDDEAVALLGRALQAGPALVLLERDADEAADDDHDAAAALMSLALNGTALRTRADLAALLERAGAAELQTSVLGWGFGAYARVTVAHGTDPRPAGRRSASGAELASARA